MQTQQRQPLSCAISWLAEDVHTYMHNSRSEQGWPLDNCTLGDFPVSYALPASLLAPDAA